MDSITDMLNRIRNAQAVGKETAAVSFSNLNYEIAKILAEEGFIGDVKKKKQGAIDISLKYEDKKPVIIGLRRISKPGRRIYIKAGEIKSLEAERRISIISTSKGPMTNKRAKKIKLGGEVLCEIW